MSEKLSGDFRKYMDKPFLGAWDIPDNSDLVLTVDYVSQDEVKNDRGSEKKLTIHFKERDYKPMICNTTNAKAISKAYGSPKVDVWVNKKIAIYKATISAFGSTTECLRVREYPPKSDERYCEKCGEIITDEIIDGKVIEAKKIYNNSISKFGKCLCYSCAVKEKKRREDIDKRIEAGELI